MIHVNPTVLWYLARTYAAHLLFLLCAFMALIYLFDTVELIRRAGKRPDIPLFLILQMGILKLPEALEVVLPFAVLFSAMFTFWQLNKRYELVVMRAGGFSVWQFLLPVLGVAVLSGVVYTAALNPLGALFLSKFEALERTHLTRQNNQIAIFREGLWLRQSGDAEGEHVILHARKISQPDWTLHDVTALYFDDADMLLKRVDAPTANLRAGQWVFASAFARDFVKKGAVTPVNALNSARQRYAQYVLKTNLTIRDVEDSFSSAETMSFWRLPDHIQTLQNTGFDASRLQVHFHALLSQPLMFGAMILLAAAVSMRPPRLRGTLMLVMAGIFIGFCVFFLSSYLQALGASRQLPPVLAAWSPAIILTLLGISAMMTLEDG